MGAKSWETKKVDPASRPQPEGGDRPVNQTATSPPAMWPVWLPESTERCFLASRKVDPQSEASPALPTGCRGGSAWGGQRGLDVPD